MLTHPLFTSSFRRLFALRGAILQAARWPMVWSLLVAVAVFAGAECAARYWLRPCDALWRYWSPEAGANFEAFQALLRSNQSVELLIVGDSTAQSDFLLEPLRPACLHSDSIWNLACPGGFARAFSTVTMPVLEHPGCRPRIVVCCFLPSAFTDAPGVLGLEQRILESPLGRQRQGGFHLGEWLHLARLWPSLRAWKAQREGKLDAIVGARGFAPRRRIIDPTTEPPPQPLPPTLQAERLEVLERLAQWAAQRHAKLVVVVPPTLDHTAGRQAIEQQYRTYLEHLKKQFGMEWFDANSSDWSLEDFADTNHLNVQGAWRLSQQLTERLLESSQSAACVPRFVPGASDR